MVCTSWKVQPKVHRLLSVPVFLFLYGSLFSLWCFSISFKVILHVAKITWNTGADREHLLNWKCLNADALLYTRTNNKNKKNNLSLTCRTLLFLSEFIARAEHRFVRKLRHSPSPVVGTRRRLGCRGRPDVTPSVKQKIRCLGDNLTLTYPLHAHVVKQVPRGVNRILAVGRIVPACHSSSVVTHSVQIIQVFLRTTDGIGTVTPQCTPY